ncbi:hypothetical protein V8F20_011604 [Naviculisporaceae sp. PSN 640]
MRIIQLLSTLGVSAIALAASDAPVVDPRSELGQGLQLGQTNLFERQNIAHANIFNRRQVGCSAQPRACINNFCARAVKEGGDEAPALTSRQEDCSSFMHKTVSYDLTTTVTADAADVKRRQQTIGPSDVPSYATAACTDAAKYSSACSCWGITASTTTVSSVATVTVQPSAIPTAFGVIQAKRADNGALVGYLRVSGSVAQPSFSTSTNDAIRFKAVGQPSGGILAQANLELENTDRGAYFGLVVGRDSTNSDIAAGSINYLYPSPVSESTEPGSVPQSVPNYYTTANGLNKQAETSVWNIDFSTGAVTTQWINTDGNTPSTLFFVQSNYLYAGGDPAAFHGRYPSPIYGVTLHWVGDSQTAAPTVT